jgi:hypothetical protein
MPIGAGNPDEAEEISESRAGGSTVCWPAPAKGNGTVGRRSPAADSAPAGASPEQPPPAHERRRRPWALSAAEIPPAGSPASEVGREPRRPARSPGAAYP